MPPPCVFEALVPELLDMSAGTDAVGDVAVLVLSALVAAVAESALVAVDAAV